MPPPSPTTQRDFPPVMRRGVWWLLGLSAFFVLAALAWAVLRKPLGVPRGFLFRFGSLLLGVAPLMVIWPLWMLRTRHIRRAIVESGGRLCTHCAYDVSALPPAGICPECGRDYDIESDKPLWEAVGARYGDDGVSHAVEQPSRETDDHKPAM